METYVFFKCHTHFLNKSWIMSLREYSFKVKKQNGQSYESPFKHRYSNFLIE